MIIFLFWISHHKTSVDYLRASASPSTYWPITGFCVQGPACTYGIWLLHRSLRSVNMIYNHVIGHQTALKCISGNNKDIVLLKLELFMIWALEGLAVWEIRRKNRTGEVEIQVGAAVKGLKRGNWRTMVGSELREENRLILFHNRIYVPRDAEL
jgi:hypothetical protein